MTAQPQTRPKRTSTRRSTARVPVHRVLGDRSKVAMSPDDVARLKAFQPETGTRAQVAWAKRAVLASGPASYADARVLCRRCCDLAIWFEGLGYTLNLPLATLLHDSLVDAYLCQTGFGEGTVQTMRSAFRRVRRATTGERKVVFAGRTDVDSVVKPIDAAGVQRFLAWVHGIDTQRDLHHDGLTLVALVRGAGCTRADLDRIDVASFRPASGGRLSLDIGGPVPRTITVKRTWAKTLLAAKRRAGNGSLFNAAKGSGALKNLEAYYYRQRDLLGPAHLSALPAFLNLNAYRAAWLVERLDSGVRLDRLLREAGLRSAAALDRYLQFLPDTVAPRRAR